VAIDIFQVQNKKIEKIQQLLMSCKGNETKYIIRSLEGKLRIGVQDKTVLTAVAQASVYASHGTTYPRSDERF